jgi:hypothetical protein
MPIDNLYALVNEAENLCYSDKVAQQRYCFIKQLAKHYGIRERTSWDTAGRIALKLSAYHGARWKHDKNKPIASDKYRGKATEILFKILKSNNGNPLSRSRIAEILSDRKCA